MIVDKKFLKINFFVTPQVKQVVFFRHSPKSKCSILKHMYITVQVTVLQTKVQVGVIFDEKNFIDAYRQLIATLILLSILSIFNIIIMDYKTYALSSAINIFIGT